MWEMIRKICDDKVFNYRYCNWKINSERYIVMGILLLISKPGGPEGLSTRFSREKKRSYRYVLTSCAENEKCKKRLLFDLALAMRKLVDLIIKIHYN
jgi:hypothetical protein